MTTYTQGFAFALAEILRYDLSTHTPQMLDRLVTQTPLYHQVIDLLTIDEDIPAILSLIESQMHLHAYKSTKIYHLTEIMPELVKKTQAYLLTRGLGGMTYMYDIEHLDDEALLAAIFLRVAS